MAVTVPGITREVRLRETGARRGALAIPGASSIPNAGAVESGPVPRVPEPSGGSTLVQVGRQLEEGADRLTAAEERMRRFREESAELREEVAVRKSVSQKAQQFIDQGNLLDDDALKQFGADLAEERENALARLGGRQESQLRLQGNIDRILATTEGVVAAKSYEAKKKQSLEILDGDRNEIMEQLGSGLITLDQARKDWKTKLESRKTFFNQNEEQSISDTGEALLIEPEIGRLVDAGQTDAARRLFGANARLFDDRAQARITTKINAFELDQKKATAAFAAKIKAVEAFAGPLGKAEILALGGVPQKAGPQTLSAKVLEFETVMTARTGKSYAAGPEEIGKIFGAIPAEERMFGAGTTGRANEIVVKMAPLYGQGLTDPDEDRQFETAVGLALAPQTTATGAMIRPAMPPYVEDALSRRGMRWNDETGKLERSTERSAQPALTPPASPPTAAPTTTGVRTAPGRTESAPAETVWNQAGFAAGLLPAAAAAASRVPGVGEIITAPKTVASRQYLENTQRNLVTVLQNNPRYPEGEREQIEKDISISPAIIDTPKAYRDRMIGIDDSLQEREQVAFKRSRDLSLKVEDRLAARNTLIGLQEFRDRLGVPVRIKTIADWERLAPGTLYLDPDLTLRRKSGEQEEK